jgi:CelD/BcsL family acetyltransferase involved in cellulose biosynthesis
VRDAVELEGLAAEWQALLKTSASAEPMLAPDWLLPWWSVYGSGRGLRVGLFTEGERLLGLAPLCVRRYWYRPGIPLQRLEFLGSDVDEGDGVCSEYLNVIAAAGQEARVAQAFAAELVHGSFGPWHELVLSALDGHGPMPELIAGAFAEQGYLCEQQVLMESPYLQLPDSWEAYLRGRLNKPKRRHLLAALRHFEAWAGSDWRIERVTSVEDLARGQAILHDLHNHRWGEGERQAGAFAKSRFLSFHGEYMPRLLEQGGLELFWLTVRGQPVAAHYQIVANGKVYYYQCGRRLDVPHRVKPGIFLLAQAIRQAIAQGQREFDSLGGDDHYKRQLARTTRPIVQLRVARTSPREALRRVTHVAFAWARSVRQRLGKVSN